SRLIQKLHSDRGGTDYLASLVNQARDVLLED
ncbi:MAG TPA: molecular chaperone DnaJ, partial [Alphaproteobacteria bacterium]|nr:molecular chaperone DnaJ [Alphaproteobacteria bacterium]